MLTNAKNDAVAYIIFDTHKFTTRALYFGVKECLRHLYATVMQLDSMSEFAKKTFIYNGY